MDVLFLSVSTGGGHHRAAEAIMERIEERYPGSRMRIVDTLRYVNPIIDKLIVGGYLRTVKKTPSIYRKIYNMSETRDNLNTLSINVNRMLSYGIESLIEEFKPSIIVCTHVFPLQMVSNLKKKGRIMVPVVTVITDFVTHSIWSHDNIEAYIVAHEYMKQELFKKGIPEQIVFPFGIPVKEEFLIRKNRLEVLKQLGLEDKPTFLITGGSLGFGEIRNTFRSLIGCSKDIQIIVVAGQNLALLKQLEKLASETDKKVIICGYTDRIADMMDAADFIITKPGGLTVSEALVKELPIFIISPIPGQEERNAHFLVNNGVAVRILNTDNKESILNQIVDNPLRVRHMKEMARCLAKPNSSNDIVSLMEKLVENSADMTEELAIVKASSRGNFKATLNFILTALGIKGGTKAPGRY